MADNTDDSNTNNIARLADYQEGWRSQCLKSKNGRVLPILANVMIALRSDPVFRNIIARDDMFAGPMLMRPLPDSTIAATAMPRPLTDDDVTEVQVWLQRAGLRVGKDVTHQAVDLSGPQCAYHPVRRYLDRVAWDGTKRLTDWLTTYLGAEDFPAHTDGRTRCFLLAWLPVSSSRAAKPIT